MVAPRDTLGCKVPRGDGRGALQCATAPQLQFPRAVLSHPLKKAVLTVFVGGLFFSDILLKFKISPRIHSRNTEPS